MIEMYREKATTRYTKVQAFIKTTRNTSCILSLCRVPKWRHSLHSARVAHSLAKTSNLLLGLPPLRWCFSLPQPNCVDGGYGKRFTSMNLLRWDEGSPRGRLFAVLDRIMNQQLFAVEMLCLRWAKRWNGARLVVLQCFWLCLQDYAVKVAATIPKSRWGIYEITVQLN